jgi:hypothetical protein
MKKYDIPVLVVLSIFAANFLFALGFISVKALKSPEISNLKNIDIQIKW